ncbi:hypothetical protein ARAM_006074 [Aspergillus rambellii]|uniref:Zn(2)-C6 fungal-type domain-containing protein n=1 Tax=Aspergillus rambellii TaxID=308745 RepID=A0A0F8U3F1_9EURO|nr:hypothetical protein ARAM_006074 [Aspergillus rambellii]
MPQNSPTLSTQNENSQSHLAEESHPPSSKVRGKDPVTARLRTACDGCHAAKIRCTGGTPCARCERDNLQCHYSYKAKIGKPKGSMNKKTLERLRAMREAQEKERKPPSTADTDVEKTRAIDSTMPSMSSNDIERPTLDIANSLPEAQEALDMHSPSNFTLDSSPFQDLVFPGDTPLVEMDAWLNDTAGDQKNCAEVFQLPNISPADLQLQNINTDLLNTRRHNEDTQNLILEHLAHYNTPLSESAFPAASFTTKPPGSHTHTHNHNHARSEYKAVPVPLFTPSTTTTTPPPPPPPTTATTTISHHYDFSHPEPPQTPPSSSSSSCTCFSTLTAHLCQLQSPHQQHHHPKHSLRLDTLLLQSQRILPATRTLLRCQSCTVDSQALFLAHMVLSRLLAWTQVSISACETRGMLAEVRLGRFQVSGEFGAAVTALLIQRHLADLKMTVGVFEQKVVHVVRGDADAAYLRLQGKNFHREIERLGGDIPRISVG